MGRVLVPLCAIVVACAVLTVKDARAAGYSLHLTASGSGVGSVNSVPSGTISCTYPPLAGTCSATVPAGTSLALVATPDADSLFSGWSGSCLNCYGTDCSLTVNYDKSCVATFATGPKVVVKGSESIPYPTLQDAYNAAPDGGTVQSRETSFPETLTVNRPVTLALRGGFDPGFLAQTGRSVVNGKLLLRAGTLVADRIAVSVPLAPPADQQAPTAPAQLQAVTLNAGQVDLTWSASTDNAGVRGYQVYRGGAHVGTTAGTSYSDSGLYASTDYCYTVLAYDGAGNMSASSSQACATTSAPVPEGPVRLALDSNGTLLSTIAAAGPGGSLLILQAGTRIETMGDGGNPEPPASLDNLYLALVAEAAALPPLPSGVTPLAQLRIVLTVDGVEREAWFRAGANGEGAKLLLPVEGGSANRGTLGLLFRAATGKLTQIGTAAFRPLGGGSFAPVARSALAPLSAGSGGSDSGQMQFSPNGTGSYSAGGSASGGGSAPAGAFWSSFTVSDPGCIPVGSVNVCGPTRVDRVEIIEESTAEILGMCWFGENNSASTGPVPSGYQFWCQRIPGAGGPTEIRVSSMQANLPVIHAYLTRESDGLPMWESYHQASGGLHTPEGVYSDPYRKKEWKYAGFKQLIFTTKANKTYSWMREHVLNPLQAKGYSADLKSFESTSPGFIADVGVYQTLDGRFLLQEDVLEDIWKVREAATRGNRGTYDYKEPKYKGTTKATMLLMGMKVWETSADVTFQKDDNQSNEQMDVYTPSGTVTQVVYTYPLSSLGVCYGVPATFTNTYEILKGDGYLSIKSDASPPEYNAGATLSEANPLPTHSYQECCPYRASMGQPVCEEMTMEPGEQEHMWLMTATGGAFRAALPDGTLQGSFTHQNAASYEWRLTPEEENQ